MLLLTRLLAASLATHRLTRLITEDVITEPLRDKVFQRFGDPSTQAARYTLSYAVTCPHCASIYVAPLVAVLATLAPRSSAATAALLALAAAGAVSLYHELKPNTSEGWQS